MSLGQDPHDEATHKALADGLALETEEPEVAKPQDSEQAAMLEETLQHVQLPADLKSILLKMDSCELAKLVPCRHAPAPKQAQCEPASRSIVRTIVVSQVGMP